MDYSTINLEKLRRLGKYILPPNHHLQKDSGNGCLGDPPGYPTYFTRQVYTQYGNPPRRGCSLVIDYEGEHYAIADNETSVEEQKRLLRELWLPLPLDHERTRLWIEKTYQFYKNCYQDVERLEYGKPGILIFPIPYYRLKEVKRHEGISDEKFETLQLKAATYNSQEQSRGARIATPANHMATIIIRRYYSEYEPERLLVVDPATENICQWWETEASQPSEEDCDKTQRWGNKVPQVSLATDPARKIL